KVRASYAGVSNPPIPYEATIAYTQRVLAQSDNSVPELSAKSEYGNESIKPERKYETEVGLETRYFQNKLGIDVTYYTNSIKDQILNLALPRSTGAVARLTNVGELSNKGIEIGVNATPYDDGNFRWVTRFNFSKNKTKVVKLAEGLEEIIGKDLDAGAALIKAEEGKELGNIYTHPILTDDQGNKVVGEDGLYVLSSEYVKSGNIMPKGSGGWSNTISYKQFALDFLIDYRYGG